MFKNKFSYAEVIGSPSRQLFTNRHDSNAFCGDFGLWKSMLLTWPIKVMMFPAMNIEEHTIRSIINLITVNFNTRVIILF